MLHVEDHFVLHVAQYFVIHRLAIWSFVGKLRRELMTQREVETETGRLSHTLCQSRRDEAFKFIQINVGRTRVFFLSPFVCGEPEVMQHRRTKHPLSFLVESGSHGKVAKYDSSIVENCSPIKRILALTEHPFHPVVADERSQSSYRACDALVKSIRGKSIVIIPVAAHLRVRNPCD